MNKEKQTLQGCEELREWLLKQGFKCSIESLHRNGNECNWYAFRRSELPARECECNDGKPMQLVVRPFACNINSRSWQSVEVDVTGEANGVWFKLSAYSMSHEDLKSRLPGVESSLIAAWNALTKVS